MDGFLQTFLQQFQHLKIRLEEITSATNDFHPNNRIGVGGFGPVYRGELSHSKGRSMVAIKRLDTKGGQGTPEFLKEVTMLSNYSHDNLICLLGFCCEGREMILVYELAARGSLDRHLNSPHLSWTQRLKICVDAAKGISYLHDPREKHQRLIHCDIKSGNVLLDDQWNAKVSDFGLSIMGSANEQQSVIVTLAAGTRGYCDPQYVMTNTLTKESDVYSFGVVLFEVLCGRLCYTHSNGHVHQILVPTWIDSYKQRNLNDIIFKNPGIHALDQSALDTFSDIACRCLKVSHEDRPNMVEVLTELETALLYQEFSEKLSLFDYKEKVKTAEPPLKYSSNGELRKILSKGALLNFGKTWFSINKKGEHCVMVSFAECLDSGASQSEGTFSSEYSSRFVVGHYTYKNPYKYPSEDRILKTRVKTDFLSPGITYKVNLVYQHIPNGSVENIVLKYKLQGDAKTSIANYGVKREDGCYMAELYELTTDQEVVDLEILFGGFLNCRVIFLEGVEFSPLEKVEYKDEKHSMSDLDANREEKLPTDYEDIMKWATNRVHWTTKKEAYSIIRKGFLINDGKKWFSLDKNGKKCHIVSAGLCSLLRDDDCLFSLPESRFGEAFECIRRPIFKSQIDFQLLSSETTYASYLVYRLPKDQSKLEGRISVSDDNDRGPNRRYIYIASPQLPVIKPKADQNTHNPVKRSSIKGHPNMRDDGWMEVQIWEFRTTTTTEMIHMNLSVDFNLLGIVIEGIEFRAT